VKDKQVSRVFYTPFKVPAVYHQLASQLVAEEAQGRHHNSHESCRRQMYARQVLDSFAEELLKNAAEPPETQVPPASFRSHTLTAILQRQLRAVHDAYRPSVRGAMIKKGERSLTLSRVTEIYLHEDPTLAYLAPRYRRHLLYLPEPWWHLGIVVNPDRLGDARFYNAVREHHDCHDFRQFSLLFFLFFLSPKRPLIQLRSTMTCSHIPYLILSHVPFLLSYPSSSFGHFGQKANSVISDYSG